MLRERKKNELDESAWVLCEDEGGEKGGSDGGREGTGVCGWDAGKGTEVDVESRLGGVFGRETGFDGPGHGRERAGFA